MLFANICVKNTRMNLMQFTILFLFLFIFNIGGAQASNDVEKQHMHNKLQDINVNKPVNVMIDFTKQQGLDNWRITNDGVMGGKSKGQFLLRQDIAIFKGYISLDNNGGFSSVFHAIAPLPNDVDTVIIDVEGDGLTYQLRMMVNLDGYRLAYKHDFNTVAGQRDVLTFKLADFQASFRGRIINDAPILSAQEIREVGFLVTKKEAGNFSLSIASLTFK